MSLNSPEFAIGLFVAIYVYAMVFALFPYAILLLFPSTRRVANRIAAAVLGGLPGGWLLSIVAAFLLPPGAFYTISLLGCCAGGYIGWRLSAKRNTK